MIPPPFLLFATLAFWGWQTDLFPWGIVLGALLESPRFVSTRWDLQPEDFRRLWNVTTLLFIGMGLYVFFSQADWGTMTDLLRDPTQGGVRAESFRQATRAALLFVQRLPLVFFPFVLAHAFSHAERLPWSAVSPYLLRRFRSEAADPFAAGRSRGFHPRFPYWLLVLFSASATDQYPTAYFLSLAALIAWALWPQRNHRFQPTVWVATLGAVLALSYVGQWGLVWTFKRFEHLESQWLNRLSGREFSQDIGRTDIGSVGRRKGSGQILLRVQADNEPPPSLLQEAAFTHYRGPYWAAIRKEFEGLAPEPDLRTWRLGRRSVLRQTVTVSRYTRKGDTPLALPLGTFELRDFPAAVIETNRLGSARAEGAPKLAVYRAHYAETNGFACLPDADDTNLDHLPQADRAAVLRLADELGLPGLPPRAAMQRLQDFLLRNFDYSLYQPPPTNAGPPFSALAHFLFTHRQGHCEYFATASTLLLRTAGVPARYAVGYSVQEHRGDSFLVRSRHAHAWTLAFVDGNWEVVDNTPGHWAEAEARQASFWEPFYDRLSHLWFAFTKWRQSGTAWRRYVFLTGIAVLSFMAWRELRGSRWRRTRKGGAAHANAFSWPGADSEFYRVENLLARRHGPRDANEPAAAWLQRLPLPEGNTSRQLRRLLELHYRLRFCPDGLTASERSELRATAETLIAVLSGSA